MLNFDTGKIICKLFNPKTGESKFVKVNTDRKYKDGVKYIKLDDDDDFEFRLCPIMPSEDDDRRPMYIVGQSGSGKSYLANQYLNEWIKLHGNKRPILFFSRKDKDDTIDAPMIKIDVDNRDNWRHTPLTVGDKDIHNTLLLFDDINTIPDEFIRAKVNQLKDDVLETGRDKRIECIITDHFGADGKRTKLNISESHYFIYFPHTAGNSLEYVLKLIGIPLKLQGKLSKIGSRWIAIYKKYPQIIISERKIWIPSKMEDEDYIDLLKDD